MTAQQKLQQLQEEIVTLEKEVGDIQEVFSYLINLHNRRHETFTYTGKMPDEQEFDFKGVIDGKEISVALKASDIVKMLERNPKMDELRQAKVKMKKVEDLLGGSE
ncbi:hypothetical protein AXI64_gp124 [Vibrio phage qdvp001]|uniref:hypothetical protein n=1 Tax=Vibrio phage qdvp001 TaxID=1003177 RepID=UPI00072034DA|nr:hypothetical protein AXI64_gp124 [Vibrio phage qdvp001]ALM62116.1 hypothetical protein qdvp001_124 [Vibrio phage qdvp001]